MKRLTPTSFNPCFGGFSFRTAKERRLRKEIAEVSILVLVDFLFGLNKNHQQSKRFQKCFNPCFGGFSFRTAGIDQLANVAEKSSFNPCFGGFSFRTVIFFGFVCVLKVFYRVFLLVCVIVVCLFDTL